MFEGFYVIYLQKKSNDCLLTYFPIEGFATIEKERIVISGYYFMKGECQNENKK